MNIFKDNNYVRTLLDNTLNPSIIAPHGSKHNSAHSLPRERPPENERGRKERKKGKSRKKRTLQEVLTRNKILLRGEKRFSHFTFASIPAWKRSVSSRLAPSGNLDSKTLKKARYSEERRVT
ncbi:hypothetical protein K0M31_005551 [Melipona bicolor]|uniref:Uncharacterized protein n=1 Tax=Melipona bicolor TaxID=60889 RepID=A0AA40FVL0_9HYME|nr:hypothetical protein K0M31_005551 [Melipona bicolor]